VIGAAAVSEAWEFSARPTVASIQEMRARIGRYRRRPIGPWRGSGDRLPVRPRRRFFPAGPLPTRRRKFARTSMQGKSYDMADRQWRDTSRTSCS